MIQPLIDTLRKYRTYIRSLKKKDACIFILDSVLKREKVRKVTLSGISLTLRTNTPDLEVAISSLVDNEYGNIKSKNPSFILDAGANIGSSSIQFALKYPNCKILAIEPEECNFKILQMNTEPFDNIVCVQAGLWGSEMKREIRNRDTGHWGYTLMDSVAKTTSLTGQEINCITVPQIMSEHDVDSIDILKMDIEGGEIDVFKTSSDWIDSVKIITIELHDRICMGCDRSFYLSTKDFRYFERNGEKVTAYREHP